jgi:hypothetical protein
LSAGNIGQFARVGPFEGEGAVVGKISAVAATGDCVSTTSGAGVILAGVPKLQATINTRRPISVGMCLFFILSPDIV